MAITFLTKNINEKRYRKAIRRIYSLNFGYQAWKDFEKTWNIKVIPVDQSEQFKRFYEHLKIEKFSEMAWGVTGSKEGFWFVTDIKNNRIMMENIPPIGHEILHIGYQGKVGTAHIKRRFDNPEGRKGTMGPAATVIPHDIWYGSKDRIKIWIGWSWKFWIPLTIPYKSWKEIKIEYKLS